MVSLVCAAAEESGKGRIARVFDEQLRKDQKGRERARESNNHFSESEARDATDCASSFSSTAAAR